MSVKVRFAPSPTGMLHIGNARTALVTWLFTREKNGHFLLRIDDTDQERSKDEYEKAIEDGLRWLGIDWDQKTRQRDRTEIYAQRIEQLKADGRLYPCYETPEELDLKRKSQLSRKLPPIYDREALSFSDEKIKTYEAEGRHPHWRFKLNHAPITWDDSVRGAVKFSGADLSDPVLIREDGSPLYHICSVIDDIEYGITHVIRGEDHVSNTACHVQMFEALGAQPPIFAHLPLLSDKEGAKLSKRIGSLSLKELQDDGLEPMSVVSLMARLGSSDPIEAFTDIQTVIKHFDITKFSRGTPKFDPDELIRLNGKILHDLNFDDIKTRLSEIGLDNLDVNFWDTVKPNIELLSDVKEWWRVAKGNITPIIEDADFIAEALELLPEAPWNEKTWMEWANAVKEKTGRKGKHLFMPLRQAITGMDHGPELASLLLLIGAENVKERLKNNKKAA
ncbi:MAG: glutamate--tRNA ligase [Zetaproteobacteria bacterium]|nr:MAG: glutamate--tRNA ligase [Zetaproteobacteria bacterium]